MKTRLLVVTKCFWPISNESTLRLLAWCDCLQREGVDITILTARWHNDWPAHSTLRSFRVIRLLPAPKSNWNEALFFKNIGLWIEKHAAEIDTIYVDEVGGMLSQVTAVAKRHTLRTIARYRAEFSGALTVDDGRLHVPTRITAPHLDSCQAAMKIVVTDSYSEGNLQAFGISSEKLVRIPDVAWRLDDWNESDRQASRLALRSVNSDYFVPEGHLLLVYVGAFVDSPAMRTTIESVGSLIDSDLAIRFWFVGLGPGLRNLYEQVRIRTLHHDIFFHSPIDAVEELFSCSDGLQLVEGQGGWEYYAQLAASFNLPILSSLNKEAKMFADSRCSEDFAVDSSRGSLIAMLKSWFNEHDRWKNRSSRLNSSAIVNSDCEKSLQSWMTLLS